jgi:hypothetical protein
MFLESKVHLLVGTYSAFLVPDIVGMYVSGRYCLFGKFTGTCSQHLFMSLTVSSHEDFCLHSLAL